jgi:threonine dehydrogenase-like Zn-dependent dehydrogenase
VVLADVNEEALRAAIQVAHPSGAVGRVGVPRDKKIHALQPAFYNNLTIVGGSAPERAYIKELLLDVLESRVEPGRPPRRSARWLPGNERTRSDQGLD